MNDFFAIWAPFDILKGSAADSEAMTGRIGGLVSTEELDQQGDRIMQKGIDWSYALSKGWFNYEHAGGPDNVLGHPENIVETVHKGQPATRIEGVLYLHKAKAREIYETALAMQKSQTDRRLGFSVEGQVKARDGDRIVKSKVLNIAITAHPVNTDARLDVLKSLAAASIGYQAPAGMGVGNIAPLIPQSLSGNTAISTFAAQALRGRNRVSVQKLADMLAVAFPAIGYPKALRLARSFSQDIGR
jgi:hypothetical protein